MSSDVVEDLILFAKHLFHQKKMRKSFNNDNKFEVPQKHSSYPITVTFTKKGLAKCKQRKCLNYSTYGVCGHTLEESACTSSLTWFLQSLQKDRHSVDFLELPNFGNPSGSGPKVDYKRVRSKNISDKRLKALFRQFSSTELTKLERLIKFNNEPEVPFGQSLEPKPPQSELQLQRHKLLKRHQQVSKCNGYGTLTNPTKNYIF